MVVLRRVQPVTDADESDRRRDAALDLLEQDLCPRMSDADGSWRMRPGVAEVLASLASAQSIGCVHKFVDSLRCRKCGVHVDDLPDDVAFIVDAAGVAVAVDAREPVMKVRPLLPDERADFEAYIEFCQREPLPASDAETKQRLLEAADRWPAIAALFSGSALW